MHFPIPTTAIVYAYGVILWRTFGSKGDKDTTICFVDEIGESVVIAVVVANVGLGTL